MNKAGVKRVVLGDRDKKILAFLWKWKLVSNAALSSKRFFPNAGIKRAYNRLHDLKRAGLLELRCDDAAQHFAWNLTSKGFKAIREYLPTLREEGYRAEHFEHDLLVTAFHIGDFLLDQDPNIKLVSEQELRRCASHEFANWVPQSDLHRPDGYFGFKIGKQTLPVAIEIELNRKVPSAYAAVGDFYAEQSDILRVLWVVPTESSISTIQNGISKCGLARTNIHNFIRLSDFRNHGWQAKIRKGPEAGRTVETFISSLPREMAVKTPRTFTARLFLNTKRSFVRSGT